MRVVNVICEKQETSRVYTAIRERLSETWNAELFMPTIPITGHHQQKQSEAWYFGTRTEFLETPSNDIANHLAGRAVGEHLDIQEQQTEEWRQSVDLLHQHLDERLPILREALKTQGCEAIRHVILEFDFRRRGLRMDCLLLADGVLFVIEFKRTRLGRADRDQVMNYAVNLIEFHEVTRRWCEEKDAIIVPILALTQGTAPGTLVWPGFVSQNWSGLAKKPLECDRNSLNTALALGLDNRRADASIPLPMWLSSLFQPSSSIIDATLSLYGNHDVVAIKEHAAPKEAIDACTGEIREHIAIALAKGAYHIVFLSGAPGAGKTLVGLDIVMRGQNAADAVFVTGNAPLVEVLNKALGMSYLAQGGQASKWVQTGYRRADAALISSAANYKIVKAHNFLGKRGQAHRQGDGRILVFDEAQRTYEKGRPVLGLKLEDHEADLILQVQKNAFPAGGAVVVALVGHNQAINRGERGIIAWLEAAERLGWSFSIADETLNLAEFKDRDRWANHKSRSLLLNGHLHQSMRYYRNSAVEGWASAVLDDEALDARKISTHLGLNDNTIWLTRDLAAARMWAKGLAVGGQRAGLIASGQARRLAAEGLFVDHKPDIATWMLSPSTDFRSSTALETVQNQYQVQGLELDYCIVCWDADLRREDNKWAAYKISGTDWQKDRLLEVAKNGYRVLLTRARKGMIIFIPVGDPSGEDQTRNIAYYNEVADYLRSCGAKELCTGST